MGIPFFFLLLLARRVDVMGGAPGASLGHGVVGRMQARRVAETRSPLLGISVVSMNFPDTSTPPPTTLYE